RLQGQTSVEFQRPAQQARGHQRLAELALDFQGIVARAQHGKKRALQAHEFATKIGVGKIETLSQIVHLSLVGPTARGFKLAPTMPVKTIDLCESTPRARWHDVCLKPFGCCAGCAFDSISAPLIPK